MVNWDTLFMVNWDTLLIGTHCLWLIGTHCLWLIRTHCLWLIGTHCLWLARKEFNNFREIALIQNSRVYQLVFHDLPCRRLFEDL